MRFVVTTGRGWEVGELDEGSWKVQTYGYKNTRDIMYNMINICNVYVYEMLYMKVVETKS